MWQSAGWAETAAAVGPNTVSIPGVTVDNYPRVDGSTSTIPLGELLASRVVGLAGELRRLPPRWDQGDMESSVLVFPLDADPQQLLAFERVWGRRYHQGTHKAYMALIQGQSDLVLTAREPSAEELQAAAAKSVSLDVYPAALDVLVFLVHDENPVSSLSLDQVRDIYTGKTWLWRVLGGKDFPIKAFGREPNSGSRELMEKLVLQGENPIQAENVVVENSMGQVIERVAVNPNAIAYSVYYYERIMAPHPRNKLLAINGVTPSTETIASHKYPLAAPVYMVTRKGLPPGSSTGKLRDWLLGEEGQRLIASSGYVPIKPVGSPAASGPELPTIP